MKEFVTNQLFRFIFLVSITFYSSNSFGDNKNAAYGKPINKEGYELKGPVYAAILMQCQFKEEFGEMKRLGSKDTCIYFLRNGNIYKETFSPTKFKKFEYDKEGYVIKEITVQTEKGKRYENGSETFYDNDTTEYIKYQNTYGINGNIEEIKTYSVNVNDTKQLERIVFANINGGQKITCFEKQGIVREMTITRNKKELKMKTSNRYFEWTKVVDALNEKGLITKRTIKLERLDGSKYSETSQAFSYDEYGNEIKRVDVSNPQKKDSSKDILIKYTYDKQGNWIRKMTYRGSSLISWEERDIYYATSDGDYNRIIEEDANKDKVRNTKLNQYKQKEDSILNVKRELEELDRAKGPIVEFADEMPRYPGDPSELFSWISKNIHYPKEAADNGEQGLVDVSFVVEKDGSTSNIKILRGYSKSLNDEAIRLVKSMRFWIPAKNDGQIVRCRYNIRIPFRLQ